MPTDSPTFASCPPRGKPILGAAGALVHPSPEERETVRRTLGGNWSHYSRLRHDGRFHDYPGQRRGGLRKRNQGAERPAPAAPATGFLKGLSRCTLFLATIGLLTAPAPAQERAARCSSRIPAPRSAGGARGGTTLPDVGFPWLGMAEDGAHWRGLKLSAGRYQVLDRLAEDECGAVFLARDHHLGTEVAVRMSRPDDPRSPHVSHRDLPALLTLARLNHPHLVRVTDVGEFSGRPFVVIEVPSGGSLKFRRRVGPDGHPAPAEPGSLGDWLLPVAEALDFLHARGFVHGDVRPGNVLFDAHGRAYLAAFGIARAGTGSGTLAIERWNPGQDESLDIRADQHALARMVDQWLTGRILPDHSPALVLPALLTSALRRGLTADPGRRFPDCTSFARAVLAAVPESNQSPESPGANPRTPPLLVMTTPSWSRLARVLPSWVRPVTMTIGAVLLMAASIVLIRGRSRASRPTDSDPLVRGEDTPTSIAPTRGTAFTCPSLKTEPSVDDGFSPVAVGEVEVTCHWIAAVFRWRDSGLTPGIPLGDRTSKPLRRRGARRKLRSPLRRGATPRQLKSAGSDRGANGPRPLELVAERVERSAANSRS